MKNETVYICLFAGPGTGKSTTAAGVFYRLKRMGFNAELIQEYAKKKVWSKDMKPLSFQPYMLGKQLWSQYLLLDEVEVAVTDSPVLLSALYQGFGCVDGFEEVIVKQFNLFNNINFYLERDSEAHPYNPKGRMQTEEGAIAKDDETKAFLDKYNIPYHTIKVSKDDSYLDKILEVITNQLNNSIDTTE